MNKFKVACIIISLVFSLAIFGGLINPQTAMADEPELKLESKYPVRPGPSDTIFDFAVELSFTGGDDPLTFDLVAEGPEGWAVSIRQSAYEDKEISAILLDPTKNYPDSIAVVAMAPFWLYPDQGDYVITLKAASGDIEASIDLTARITARYNFTVVPKYELYNAKATAGKETNLTLIITNTGTASLDKITPSSLDPRGVAGEEWSTTFNPEEIEGLSPGHEQEVTVTIKPPSKTIAGDYMVTLRFLSDPTPAQGPSSLDIRVTVGTSTAWGWIGAIIVVIVLGGLYFVFRRFGRR